MTLSCVHIVQYLSVECGVVWQFIEYDVLNPSDSIPGREGGFENNAYVKQKRNLITWVSLLSLGMRFTSRWMIGIKRTTQQKNKPHLR